MSRERRGNALLIAMTLQLAASPASAIMSLSLEGFTEIALRQSLRARVDRNAFDSARLLRTADYRTTRFPVMSMTGSAVRSYSDTLLGRTYSTDGRATLFLDAPIFLTGGSVSLSGTRSRFLTDSSGVLSRSDLAPSFHASLIQPLYVFAGDPRRRSWRRSELRYRNAEDSLRRDELATWADARRFYYLTIQRQSALEVEKRTLESSLVVLRIARVLVEAGEAASVELSRSELRFARQQRTINSATTALNQGLNEVRTFLQLPPDTPFVLTTTLEFQPFTLELRDLLSEAFKHRADYLAAQRSLELTEISLKEARESDNLNLSFVSSYDMSRETQNPGAASAAANSAWSIGALASWSFFNSGVTRLTVRQGMNTLENARIAFDSIRQSIEVEIKNSYLNVKSLEEQLREFEVNRTQAANNLKAVQYRYSSGIDRLLDVFDAENELRTLELEYLNNLVSYHSAKDALTLAVGVPVEASPK